MTTGRSGSAAEPIDALAARLRAEATPERAEKEKAYLRSDLTFLGAAVPAIRKACVALRRARPELTRGELIDLVDEAWGRGIHELRMAAVELLELYGDRLTPDDAPVIERLVRESGTWALVDGLAASVTGGLVDRFPDAMHPILERWARDEDFWLRRASLLAYLLGIRRGGGISSGSRRWPTRCWKSPSSSSGRPSGGCSGRRRRSGRSRSWPGSSLGPEGRRG